MDKKHNNLAQPETEWSTKKLQKEAISPEDHQGTKIANRKSQKPL